MKHYDAIVYIGRFQPFHNGHLDVLKAASELTDYLILIVGSQFQHPSYKNPFQAVWRHPDYRTLLRSKIMDLALFTKVEVHGQKDIYGDELWCKSVQEKVIPTKNVGIIGCNKDQSSYYLNIFPDWDVIEVPMKQNISATQIRELYFVENPVMDFISGVVPSWIFAYLNKNKNTEWHADIVQERRYIEKYKEPYKALPYPPTFVTVDAVVFKDNKVLMILRKDHPGKNTLALPGGFLDANTDISLKAAMLRELKEETGLELSENDITTTEVFDSPYRSSRGRTITHAFCIHLKDGDLPPVQAGSDASRAEWINVSYLNSLLCFEDHYQIIQLFLNRVASIDNEMKRITDLQTKIDDLKTQIDIIADQRNRAEEEHASLSYF